MLPKREYLLSPELFDDVVEYVKGRQAGRSEDEDDFLTEDHPLVAFCQDLLEQLSAALLTQRIIGFGPHARRRLALERRRGSRRGLPQELLRVLFELESVGSTLGTATYTRNDEVTQEFFATEFIALLRSVVAYLRTTRPNAVDTDAAENALVEVAAFLGIEQDIQ